MSVKEEMISDEHNTFDSIKKFGFSIVEP